MGIILSTACLLLLYEVFARQGDRTYCAHIAVIGCGLALYATASALDHPPVGLFAMPGRPAPIVVDAFANLSSSVMIAGALIACLLSPAYGKNAKCDHGEYYALILFAVAGMMVMAMAGDLITLF